MDRNNRQLDTMVMEEVTFSTLHIKTLQKYKFGICYFRNDSTESTKVIIFHTDETGQLNTSTGSYEVLINSNSKEPVVLKTNDSKMLDNSGSCILEYPVEDKVISTNDLEPLVKGVENNLCLGNLSQLSYSVVDTW